MVRALEPAVSAQKDAPLARPAVLLRLEFPAPSGARWYSDRVIAVQGLEVEPRIVSCGPISWELAAGRPPAVSDARLELRDEDGALRELFAAHDPQRVGATVFLHFEGLDGSTMTPILGGIVASPVGFREAESVLELDVVDASRNWAVQISTRADRATFPRVAPEDESRPIPIVFGRVRRMKALAARCGRVGRLMVDCSPGSDRLYIQGFEELPAGTPLTVEIGRERIEGTISGVVFNVTRRGGGTIKSGVTTHATGRQCAIRDAHLAGFDNEYVGYCLKIFIPGARQPGDIPYTYRYGPSAQLRDPAPSGYEYRLITRFDASSGTLEYWPPFTVEGTRSETPELHVSGIGHVRLIPAGTPYEITTLPSAHRAGEPVREVIEGGWVYILNDAPSVRVDAVYLFGRRVPDPVLLRIEPVSLGGGAVGALGWRSPGEQDLPDLKDDWIPVRPEFYSVNLCDTTSFPELGRPLTTVTFRRDPFSIPGLEVAGSELRADVIGTESAGDGTGEPVENPALVIRTLLERWGRLRPGVDIDEESFQRAALALSRVRFAFALEDTRELPRIASDLAFQARSALLWKAGKASLLVLRRSPGEPQHTLSADDRAEGSLELTWDDSDGQVSSIVASFREDGRPRELIVADEQAIATWGLKERRIDFWAYGCARFVEEAARFWLERWKAVRRRVHVATFLQALAVEPGDIVRLGDWKGEIQRVKYLPGSGRSGRIDRIELELRLPAWAGCSSSCELACESSCQSGCEAFCETACETTCELACELSCQGSCELACTAAAESLCQTDCMATSCEVACEVLVTGLVGWGCGACQTDCQVSCECSCESLCESLCESGGEA